MDQIEQIVSDLMMPIKKVVNDSYYYGRHPEDSRKELEKAENKLAEKLQEQYERGQQDLAKAWQRKHLGVTNEESGTNIFN